MNELNRIHIVGIGDDGLDGLTATARELVRQADLILGGSQSLAVVRELPIETIEIEADLDRMVHALEERPGQRIVILVVGDPLFYGMSRYLCGRLGKDRFEVVPHVSSMQLAFARIKESWDEAYLTNMATQDLARAIEKIRTADKVGLFTTEEYSPATIAQSILEAGIDYFYVYVCENLGGRDERVTQGTLVEIVGQTFSPLNVMILVRREATPDMPGRYLQPRLFGNPDDAFLQSRPKRGLLTPAEVRSVSLAELDLARGSIVWDVGAGSGSVAIEAAQIAAGGQVFAIEMDPDDHLLIVENASRFQVRNLHPILGAAPDAWHALPDPDAIFVGGTGRKVRGIVDQAFRRLRSGGRIVVNVASLDNVAEVHALLTELAGDAKMLMISVSRGAPFVDRLMLEASKPMFLISAIRPL